MMMISLGQGALLHRAHLKFCNPMAAGKLMPLGAEAAADWYGRIAISGARGAGVMYLVMYPGRYCSS
jgi:hypothetical protein